MNGPSFRTPPGHDDRAAAQPLASPRPLARTEDFAPASDPSHRQVLALKQAATGGTLPHLTGEVRDLIHIRLREVAVLVTIGWVLVLLLCLSGLDGLFNRTNLGTGCVAAIAVMVLVFVASWVSLRGGPRSTLARLRGYEAVFLWGSVVCAAWLRYAAVGHALSRDPPDRFMVLYASSLSGLIWMTVIIIYGIFAPNTWRRLVLMPAGIVSILVATEVATWARQSAADRDLFVSNLLITLLAVFLAIGIGLYGSFKLGTAQEEAITARRQLRDLG